jgi:hypothetical protein
MIKHYSLQMTFMLIIECNQSGESVSVNKRIQAVTSVVLAGGIIVSGLLVPSNSKAADSSSVSLRQTIESLNGTLGWKSENGQIQIDVSGEKAELQIGSMDATIKGKAVTLDQKPFLQNGAAKVSANTLKQLQDAFKKTDKLLFSFSTVGDSRVDTTVSNLPEQDYKWLVNSKVMTRMMDEITGQNAKMLFYNGDMIMGYTPNSDVNVLNRQYAFWRGIVATLFEHGTYVFPVPGNHEVQDKYNDEKGKTVKIATQANENTWRDNMGDIIIDEKRFQTLLGEKVSAWDPKNAPQIGSDHISTDQSKLSYSFDFNGSHFVIINTDPKGYDTHAPVEWLAQDLADAKKRGMKHSFVFGHKLAYTYYFDKSTPISGLDADMVGADAFWKVIQDNNATYFSGHEHIFNASQPKNGKAYQIVAGSGGSPFEAQKPTGNPIDRDFAWVTVKVYESGKVHLDAYGFDEYFGPTQNFMSWDLEAGF